MACKNGNVEQEIASGATLRLVSILATVHYLKDPKTPVVRSYQRVFGIIWTGDMTLESGGNPYVLKEHSFGGYQLHIKFTDAYWNWNSNVYTLDFVLEDYWAIDPAGHIVNAGDIYLTSGFTLDPATPAFAIDQPPGLDFAYLQMPNPPPSYWLQLPLPASRILG